jgi:predicted RNase H-like HicB family nuclease
MTRKFVVILTESEVGGIVAECPSLPGCYSQGETREEALENIREAIELSLETRETEGLPTQVVPVEVAEVQLAVNG